MIVPNVNAFTEKTVPVGADIAMVEDSADTYAKKKVQLSNFVIHRDSVALVDQTASIVATNLTNSQTAGRYLVAYTLLCTTEDAGAVSVKLTFAWTDAAGATSVDSSTVDLTAKGRTSGVLTVQVASGAFTYATTVDTIGSAKYALYIDSNLMS